MKKNLKNDYFNSIDELPIWNWWKVSETGNFIYLLKENDYNNEDYSLESYKNWLDLQDEYLEFFGMDSDFQKILRLKKQWIDKKSKYIIDNDRFSLTEAEIIESKIKEITDNNKTLNQDSTIILLEEKLGREIDPKKISVKKFYNYIKHYSNNG